MADADVATLKLSEVARRCGVDASLLRTLAEDGLLSGIVRSSNGHVYMRDDAVPTWHQLHDIVETALVRHAQAAQSALARVRVEVEAVDNDLQMLLDDPGSELGDDLISLRTYPDAREKTSLTSALGRLERASWRVRIYSDALRHIREVG
jgi:DNA-binding transcriptional MerR regulator